MDNLPLSQRFDPYAHGIASGYSDVFTPFLGPAPREARISPYAKKSTAKWNMPESYVGENEFLGNTIEDAVLTAQDSWYTTRIMPWYRTENIHLQWTEWDNNVHYMGITPHQAISKVVTQRRTVRKASIVRRGIAAEFENDFVGTPLGRSSFMASLSQMARSFQETGNVEVLRALIGCHRSTQVFTRKQGVVADFELDEWLNRKAEQFMAVQKDPFGLEKTNTRIEKEQEMWGGMADTWILGREIMDYCSNGSIPEKSLFYLGGQEAVDRVNGRPQNGVAAGNTMGNVKSLQPENFISGLPVYLAKSYSVDSVGKADLLSRTVEVGVYNMMVDRTRDYTRYRRESRNLRVFDNDIDTWSEIELHRAIYGCGIWNEKGTLSDPFARSVNGRTGLHSAQVDDDFDFLSFSSNGVRRNIEYVGDMSKNWLNSNNLEDAGQTMLNVLAHHDQTQAQRLVVETEKMANRVNAGGFVEFSPEEEALVRDLALGIENLVGTDNVFFSGVDESGIRISPASVLADSFVRQGINPNAAAPAAAAGGGEEAAQMASRIGATSSTQAEAEKELVLNIVGAAVPDAHKNRLAAIAAKTNQPWASRLEEVKALVLSIQAETPDEIHSHLSTPAKVDKWFNTQKKEFQERIDAGDFGRPAAAAVPVAARQGRTAAARRQPSTPAELLASMPAFAAFVRAQGAAPSGGAAGGRGGGARRAHIGGHMGASAPGDGHYVDRAQMRATDKAARGSAPTDITLEATAAAGARYFNLASHLSDIAKGSAPRIIKWLASIYAACAFTRDRLVALARNHVYVPIGLLLMRPHCTYKTRFGIKVAAGGKAGYTFFGHSNMQIEHEAARKVGMMHYTAYLSAVVLYPKNVYVVEDLFCEKYLGGMGVEFWDPVSYKNGTARRNARSIICAPLPPNFKKIEQKIDIRGRWYTEQQMGLVTQERFDSPLYPGANRINLNFGLQESIRKDKSSNRSRVAINFICWQGHEWYYNAITGKWDDFTVEAGHFGPNVYPGCGKVRNGADKFLRNCNYEVAGH